MLCESWETYFKETFEEENEEIFLLPSWQGLDSGVGPGTYAQLC